ncbi:MAG: adaptor protein MecA [Lachnospiraceae bacterium]|nr:adaptor protein MecA [Lachnospiraceae bacterium]
MKIERINANQIRCTLDMTDLASRHLNLKELAYGSDKARMLFSEMMEKAHREFNFEYSGTPLMIEAIPMPHEQLMLIVTKIEDPEELDTRFSTFAPSVMSGDSAQKQPQVRITAEDILKAMHHLFPQTDERRTSFEESAPAEEQADISRTFLFKNINELFQIASVLADVYHGYNSLYRRPGRDEYYLVAHKSDHSAEEFNKICNVFTEFGAQVKPNCSLEAYYREHYELLMEGDALEQLV